MREYSTSDLRGNSATLDFPATNRKLGAPSRESKGLDSLRQFSQMSAPIKNSISVRYGIRNLGLPRLKFPVILLIPNNMSKGILGANTFVEKCTCISVVIRHDLS
jgi:hypothetical protein